MQRLVAKATLNSTFRKCETHGNVSYTEYFVYPANDQHLHMQQKVSRLHEPSLHFTTWMLTTLGGNLDTTVNNATSRLVLSFHVWTSHTVTEWSCLRSHKRVKRNILFCTNLETWADWLWWCYNTVAAGQGWTLPLLETEDIMMECKQILLTHLKLNHARSQLFSSSTLPRVQ